jgi:hypothetical protein
MYGRKTAYFLIVDIFSLSYTKVLGYAIIKFPSLEGCPKGGVVQEASCFTRGMGYCHVYSPSCSYGI